MRHGRFGGFRVLGALVPLGLAAAIAAAGCGSDNGIVGGSCVAGFAQCGVACVDLETDSQNCGACGRACPGGAACSAGECPMPLGDGAMPNDGANVEAAPPEDASRDATQGAPADGANEAEGDGASAGDATAPDGADASGGEVDAAGDGADATRADAADATIADATAGDATAGGADASAGDATTTGSDAGGGLDAAGDGAIDGSAVDAGNACAPLTSCGGTCVDTSNNPFNCGGCGIVCPSQICSNLQCVGATAGSVVLVGHDYESTLPGTAQARVLSNAVFLWPSDPVDVLLYDRDADATAVARITAILQAAATRFGRTLVITPSETASDIPSLLVTPTFGVLLVADQVDAPGDLTAVGGSWATTLSAFVQSGGIVVFLDGGTGADAMPSLVTATGLLDVASDATVAAGDPLDVLAPSDAVSVGVVTPYAAGTNTATVSTEPNAGNVSYVVGSPAEGGADLPVVVHKVF